jgi:hypothetical protein
MADDPRGRKNENRALIESSRSATASWQLRSHCCRDHAAQSAVVIGVLVAAAVVSLFFPRAGILALLMLFPAQAIAGRRGARTSRKR